MMQHNNTANTHRSLCALAIVFTSTKWGRCPLIRVCSLIRSNTVFQFYLREPEQGLERGWGTGEGGGEWGGRRRRKGVTDPVVSTG